MAELTKLILVAVFLTGCATSTMPKSNTGATGKSMQPSGSGSPFAPNGGPWLSERYQDHVLVGQIWDVAAGVFVDRETLADELAKRRFVLLGEKHDNPDHHRLEAHLLQVLLDKGRRPAVAFEMLDSGRQAAIDAYLRSDPHDVDGLAGVVEWEKSGWPDWP